MLNTDLSNPDQQQDLPGRSATAPSATGRSGASRVNKGPSTAKSVKKGPFLQCQRRRLARLGSSWRIRARRSRSRSARDQADAVDGLGDDGAPGVDDHAVAEAAHARIVIAGLAGRDHVALVLDRPGAQQHLPVVPTGVGGERGRHQEHPGAGDRPAAGRARGSAGRSRSTGRPGHPRRRRSRRRCPARPGGTPERTPGRGSRCRTDGSCGRSRPGRRRRSKTRDVL